MRPFATSCQRQIRHFHSFLCVLAAFSGVLSDFYHFCGSFAGNQRAQSARNSGLRGLSAFIINGRFNSATNGAAARK
jgi:hypothetical protein